MQKPLLDLVLENERLISNSIRLIASENLPDIGDRIPYILDMYARYAFSGTHDQTTGYFPQYNLREIETITKTLASESLNSKYVNVRPISGMNCMLTTIAALTKKGDLAMAFAPQHGGHGETASIFETLSLDYQFLPFDTTRWEIDLDALNNMKDLERVRLVYLDLCMVLFPQPIAKLKAILPKTTKIVYDGSHVLGLLCGGLFQKPLAEGADVLVGSTHKTLPGPHKGIIATNSFLLDKKIDAVSYHFTSHHHIADVACLGLVLEKGRLFYSEYGSQVISNAQCLAKLLANQNIRVQFPSRNYTNTHQIWLDLGDLNEVNRITKGLYRLNVIVNAIMIPNLKNWGVRIGTQEITQLGITEAGLIELADIIADVIHNKSNFTTLEKRVYRLTQEGFTQFAKNRIGLDIAKEIISRECVKR